MKDAIIDTIKVFTVYAGSVFAWKFIDGITMYQYIEAGLKLLALTTPIAYTIWKWVKEYKQK